MGMQYFVACASCHSRALHFFLLPIFGKVNVRNRHRETPLLLAVRANNAEAVAGLLGFGARLDEPDVNGKAVFVPPRSPDGIMLV